MFFVIGEDDDATTCVFPRGCSEVSELRKYDFLNIAKTNIPLRFKENIINYYFYYVNCWFTRSESEKHWKTPIGLRTCPKHNCAI
jgi:hypothetical protein